jgi:hypothetical protein
LTSFSYGGVARDLSRLGVLLGVRFRGPALLLVLVCLVFNALDCNGAWLTDRQAKKCCAKGHCTPANQDPCCKNAPIGQTFALAAYAKATVPGPVVSAHLAVPPLAAAISGQRVLFYVEATGPPPPLIFADHALPLRV